MMVEELRRGWCPGALRPMLSGDGYIVRIRPRGPVIPQALAYALADLADRFGNGLIDLTARANLQLRGVREETFQPLQTALADLGLLDASIAQEARRNILLSPLCGIDPTAALDSRPLYTALEAWLMNDDTLAALPGKFGFGIDEGGLLPLPADASDLHARAQRTSEGPRWAVFAGDHRLITCHPDDCLPVMKTLTQTFLRLTPEGGRMKALLASIGPVAFLQAAGLATTEIAKTTEPAPPLPQLGIWPLTVGPFILVGVPFGRLHAEQMRCLAQTGQEFRLTPWRSLVLPLTLNDAPAVIASGLSKAGFILDPDAALMAIAACSGAPACDRASRPAREDARRFAANVPQAPHAKPLLHVSGCAKGCAHPRAAPITLVAREGRYDVVLRYTAAAPPDHLGLTVADAQTFLTKFFKTKGI